MKIYTLNAVAYGTSCAPYLAIRCLKQLAEEDEAKLYPAAGNALRFEFYMDHVLTGCSTVEKAIDLQQQLQTLLAKGQFPLRKWRTNDARILEHLTEQSKADDLLILDEQEPLKTLGSLWNSSLDTLQYSEAIAEDGKPTKRNILSQIARIYDPLGLIGLVIMRAKMLMQELWKLTWDKSVRQAMYTSWLEYYRALPKINDLIITRNVNPGNKSESFDLYGFGDASEKAYGACIYYSYETINGKFKSFLLCSKTRVAPLKTKIRVMCGSIACQTNRLGQKRITRKSTKHLLMERLDNCPVLDSNESSRAEDIFCKSGSGNSSADCGRRMESFPSRRQSRGYVVTRHLGRNYRQQSTMVAWPHMDVIEKDVATLTAALQYRRSWPQARDNTRNYLLRAILEKHSSFLKLQRIFGYVVRFIQIAKGNRQKGTLTTTELDKSAIIILRITQRERFKQELINLRANQGVDNRSFFRQLNPFIDDSGLNRVGGRLRNADVPANQKHPIVLPSKPPRLSSGASISSYDIADLNIS